VIQIADMADHVERLCRSHEISIHWCQRSTQSYAVLEFYEITIAPIKSVVTYATALHEIGHILGRYQEGRDSMVRERWAWQWAKRNALIWTPRMARHADDSLQRYADGGAAVVDRNWRPPSIKVGLRAKGK
jgi:CRISPR/Cas system-associated endonuclease Cas3-HD